MKDLIRDEEVISLMSAIHRRYGLDFTKYEIKSLKRGITRLMTKHKMNNILELWAVILKDNDFFKKSIDDLMVNPTEMFRNADAWIMIRDNIIKLFSAESSLKIWHAGCSTGEEVYTLAIILDELDRLKSTKAVATDLSSRALAKAKNGDYSLSAMKNYMKPILKFYPDREAKDFFDFHNNHAKVKARFKQHVEFRRHNLVHDPMEERFNITFCRNVMIYFDDTLKMEVVKLIYNSMEEGGVLILGYYDTMPMDIDKYFQIYDSKTRIYKKITN